MALESSGTILYVEKISRLHNFENQEMGLTWSESSGMILGLYVAKISYKVDKWSVNSWRGEILHRNTHIGTHTHAHRCPFYVLFFCENTETRLKRNSIPIPTVQI